jgi:hypothetical protein
MVMSTAEGPSNVMEHAERTSRVGGNNRDTPPTQNRFVDQSLWKK